MLKKWAGRVQISFTCVKQEPVAGFHVKGNEYTGYIKYGDFFTSWRIISF
jgi:hypothetical protein